SAKTKAHTEETTVAGRSTLTHKPQPYQIAANTETNLTIGVDALSKQNDATKLLDRIPQGSTVSLDRAYYTKGNIEACEERGHHYHIRPKKWRGEDYRGAVFRRCREAFDQNQYRWRKLVERTFANMEARAGKTSYYEDQEDHNKVLKLGAVHHNIKRTSFLLGMRYFFVPLGKPPPEEVALPNFIKQTLCVKTGSAHSL
ncbi:MAG: transposase, partial [Candidatus Freyarchaeota archaeon]|nr:transposase [Candidatus Jordarchaeia archaeon]